MTTPEHLALKIANMKTRAECEGLREALGYAIEAIERERDGLADRSDLGSYLATKRASLDWEIADLRKRLAAPDLARPRSEGW